MPRDAISATSSSNSAARIGGMSEAWTCSLRLAGETNLTVREPAGDSSVTSACGFESSGPIEHPNKQVGLEDPGARSADDLAENDSKPSKSLVNGPGDAEAKVRGRRFGLRSGEHPAECVSRNPYPTTAR